MIRIMKRNKCFGLRAGLCGAMFLLAVGCAQTQSVVPGPQAATIGFAMPVTRAAVDGFAAGDAFAVWGWYTPADEYSQVFDATKVSTSDGANWSYDNLQFWLAGKEYAFQALYPETDLLPAASARYAEDGTLTVTGFDASQQVDLMAASSPVMSGSTPAPVAFSFTHLLARVQVVASCDAASAGIEGFTPRVYGVSLYGAPRTGDLALSAGELTDSNALLDGWTAGADLTTADAPLAEFRSDAGEVIGLEASVLLDALPMPGSLTRDYYIGVEYSTDAGGVDRKTATIQLTSLAVTSWTPGRLYRYTFSLSDNDRILFATPSVNAWDEAIGGVIIVD